jgi:hypothetical protein
MAAHNSNAALCTTLYQWHGEYQSPSKRFCLASTRRSYSSSRHRTTVEAQMS